MMLGLKRGLLRVLAFRGLMLSWEKAYSFPSLSARCGLERLGPARFGQGDPTPRKGIAPPLLSFPQFRLLAMKISERMCPCGLRHFSSNRRDIRRFVRTPCWVLPPRGSDFTGLGRGLSICSSDKLPGAADAAGLWTPLWGVVDSEPEKGSDLSVQGHPAGGGGAGTSAQASWSSIFSTHHAASHSMASAQDCPSHLPRLRYSSRAIGLR